MRSLCLRCKRELQNREVKFALGKYSHTEGNTHYYKGPVLSVAVCETCFSRFYDYDEKAETGVMVAIGIGGILSGIAGIMYVQFVKDIPSWSALSDDLAKANLLGDIFLIILMLGLTLLVWFFVGLFSAVPGAVIGAVLSAPFWGPRVWACRKGPYLKAHPMYNMFWSLGYKEVFWSDKQGNIKTTKFETTYVEQ